MTRRGKGCRVSQHELQRRRGCLSQGGGETVAKSQLGVARTPTPAPGPRTPEMCEKEQPGWKRKLWESFSLGSDGTFRKEAQNEGRADSGRQFSRAPRLLRAEERALHLFGDESPKITDCQE